MYSIQKIASVVNGKLLQQRSNSNISHLLHDSRRVAQGEASLFFALTTSNADGHRFIADAYSKSVRSFIISRQVNAEKFPEANLVLVEDTLKALQQLAAFHRSQFSIPVIGITGSNGKTVVKEWLYQLFKEKFHVVRSPRSYNSQIGVALSVWELNKEHELAIFEAGISEPGEMENLQRMVQPTLGVLTNIGNAHDAAFLSKQQKLAEKLQLFKSAEQVIGPSTLLKELHGPRLFTWGETGSDLFITDIKKGEQVTTIEANCQGAQSAITIPFTDDASIQNAITCWCVAICLQALEGKLLSRFMELQAVDMRLQLKHGLNSCLLINDSYSADITSLKIALDFLQQQSTGLKRTVILSEFLGAGEGSNVYGEISRLLQEYGIQKLVLIGEEAAKRISIHLHPSVTVSTYLSTDDFLKEFRTSLFSHEIILLKGARSFGFERIASLFENKVHQTVLQINLNALVHNLKQYQKLLKPGTGIMAMVKAFSYGSGGAEIASVLQYHNVQYLGVAYADEGVELVKAGIRMPIMVMNAESSTFQFIVDYNLQPVIYSFDLLHQFGSYLHQQGLKDYPVHIEVETGMHRLGFAPDELGKLADRLSSSSPMIVQSVFSHLASSDDAMQDAFTLQQAQIFEEAVDIFKQKLPYTFLRHLANSAAIFRHPHLQYELVRLGIGLYGIDTVPAHSLQLQPVASLRTTIAQVKRLKKGESVSYNRKWVAQRDSLIATVRIGYADGYSRRLGNGVGQMWAGGKLVPVVGSVCMDMTMLDVTDAGPVREGDEVLVFGEQVPVQQLAQWMNTIPYEVLTSISHRVKRIYFQE